MGQYHRICNMDRHEYLDPSGFGEGPKLMEFGQSASGSMTALAVLLSEQNGRGGGDAHEAPKEVAGRWAGDRICIIGDYFKRETDAVGGVDNPWLDDSAPEPWTDITDMLVAGLPTEIGRSWV